MIIHFIKFIHVLLTLALLGLTGFCFITLGARKLVGVPLMRKDLITRLNKAMLHTALLAMLTGTFLVYPKHFTFHTPWIQAAYLLVSFFCLMVVMLIALRDRKHLWIWRGIYLFLFLLLVCVVHDAVTKSTFLF